MAKKNNPGKPFKDLEGILPPKQLEELRERLKKIEWEIQKQPEHFKRSVEKKRAILKLKLQAEKLRDHAPMRPIVNSFNPNKSIRIEQIKDTPVGRAKIDREFQKDFFFASSKIKGIPEKFLIEKTPLKKSLVLKEKPEQSSKSPSKRSSDVAEKKASIRPPQVKKQPPPTSKLSKVPRQSPTRKR